MAASSPKTATELTTARRIARRPSARPAWSLSPRSLPPPAGWPDIPRSGQRLLQDGDAALALDPLLPQRIERAVCLEGADRRIDAGGQRAALVEDGAEVLLGADRRQGADDRPVRQQIGRAH